MGTRFRLNDWVDKRYLRLVNGCLVYHGPIVSEACPLKQSQTSRTPIPQQFLKWRIRKSLWVRKVRRKWIEIENSFVYLWRSTAKRRSKNINYWVLDLGEWNHVFILLFRNHFMHQRVYLHSVVHKKIERISLILPSLRRRYMLRDDNDDYKFGDRNFGDRHHWHWSCPLRVRSQIPVGFITKETQTVPH